MQPKLPIRKSKDEIEFYIKHGKTFGDILFELYTMVTEGKLHTGLEIKNKFFSLVCNVRSPEWEKLGWPFQLERNSLGETYGKLICVSVNDTIAHGKPTDEPFEVGDVVSVDCGIYIDYKDRRLHFDSAFTTTYGCKPSDWVLTPHSALRWIKGNQSNSTYSVAETIENCARFNNLQTVVMLTGHGIGYSLHEEPIIRNAPGNYSNTPFFEGLCFCPEPIFVLPGDEDEVQSIARAYLDSDGWSIKTVNSQPASHFETMFCIHNKKLVDICGITDWFC